MDRIAKSVQFNRLAEEVRREARKIREEPPAQGMRALFAKIRIAMSELDEDCAGHKRLAKSAEKHMSKIEEDLQHFGQIQVDGPGGGLNYHVSEDAPSVGTAESLATTLDAIGRAFGTQVITEKKEPVPAMLAGRDINVRSSVENSSTAITVTVQQFALNLQALIEQSQIPASEKNRLLKGLKEWMFKYSASLAAGLSTAAIAGLGKLFSG